MSSAPSPIFIPVAEQIPGAQGTESPGSAPAGADYLEHYANRVPNGKNRHKCPNVYLTAECENGHRFLKTVVCGKEYCPNCGADWSDAHKRRFSRWLPKAERMKEIGYFVFTIPTELRDEYRTQEALNELTKRVTAGDKSKHIDGLLKSLGFDRGLCRWHWFGDKSHAYHPHLNVLIEAGQIPAKTLAKIKREYAKILGVPMVVVNYSYTRKQKKMVHILKYITRSTFTDRDWDHQLADELFNFRNMRSWGDWSGKPEWELKGKSKYAHIEDIEHGICPVCGTHLHWNKPLPICLMEMEHPVDIGAGYYRADDGDRGKKQH